MDRLVLMGVSHRRGGAGVLETYQQTYAAGGPAAPDADVDPLQHLAADLGAPLVPIVTCNRFDVVAELPDHLSLAEVRDRLAPAGQPRPYVYLADGALEQLTRIAASLDSLNPGEDQIMRQVRDAYKAARRQGSVDGVLAYAFDTALRIAKRVRREVELAPMNTSLFSLARPEIERLAAERGRVRVAVLGAGEMGSLAATGLAALRGVELVVVNRSVERARQVARHLRADHRALDAFRASPDPDLDAIVCATPVAGLIGPAQLDAMARLALAVDLGIPRNVAPDAAADRALRVLDVDTLQDAGALRRDELHDKLAEAEGIVRSELDAAVDAWAEKQLGAAIRKLRAMYVETIGDRLPRDEAERLAQRFAHVPILGLRGLAREHGLDAAQTFLDEAGIS